MPTLTTTSPATLYLNGQLLGTAQVTLPAFSEPEPVTLSVSQTVDFILNYPPGKKGRRQRQQLCNLLWSPTLLRYAHHYQAVRHHQVRKRLGKKRK